MLVAAAREAVFVMRRWCALLGIRDSALQCTLSDTLVLPILSNAVEVWGYCEAAEVLHKSFLEHLLGIHSKKDCTSRVGLFSVANPLVACSRFCAITWDWTAHALSCLKRWRSPIFKLMGLFRGK